MSTPTEELERVVQRYKKGYTHCKIYFVNFYVYFLKNSYYVYKKRIVMRKLFKCFSIMAIYLLITACPYESSVPLASPSDKLIPELLGKWIVHDG